MLAHPNFRTIPSYKATGYVVGCVIRFQHLRKWMFPKIMGKPPNHPILIGCSIIFTIHFGGKKTPIFGNIQMLQQKLVCFSENHQQILWKTTFQSSILSGTLKDFNLQQICHEVNTSNTVWWYIGFTRLIVLQLVSWNQKPIPNCSHTPPKFKLAPEKWCLEDEFPFGIAYF